MSEAENKRFVVRHSASVYTALSQFETKELAIGFTKSEFFKNEGYNLHYIYDRETKKHIAGTKKYHPDDDEFCIKLNVTAQEK